MKKGRAENRKIDPAPALGERAFAAISAVEGLSLNDESRKRLASLGRSQLSAEEQREAVILAYKGRKSR